MGKANVNPPVNVTSGSSEFGGFGGFGELSGFRLWIRLVP